MDSNSERWEKARTTDPGYAVFRCQGCVAPACMDYAPYTTLEIPDARLRRTQALATE